jgi:hypothetical protein
MRAGTHSRVQSAPKVITYLHKIKMNTTTFNKLLLNIAIPDNHEILSIYLYVFAWEKYITLVPSNKLSAYLLSAYDEEPLMDMIFTFKYNFMLVSEDLDREV